MPSLFQSFDDVSEPQHSAERLAALRKVLSNEGVTGFIVRHADEHQSEYLPAHAERLSWLTGFTGSAGMGIVFRENIALFVDGRYTLQAEQQVDRSVVTVVASAKTSPEVWLKQTVSEGDVLGFDPWLHTKSAVEKLEKLLKEKGARLKALSFNPIDRVWKDQPSAPLGALQCHPLSYAGEEAGSKIGRVQAKLEEAKLDALLVSDPHNLAWLFNVRGSDIPHTPIPLGYALVPADGRPVLVMPKSKMTAEVYDSISQVADVRDDLKGLMSEWASRKTTIRFDQSTAAYALQQNFSEGGGTADVGADPITLMKAVKNKAEIAGARAAHLRDGEAVRRFIAWFKREAPKGHLTEIDAVIALEEFRRETGCLKDISFPTISGSGPNGAIVHYRVTQASNRRIGTDELFLIDSGAQYEDGTTDITRTLINGTPSDEMRDRYTRVLKGHIAIASAVFPKGTTGAQIDGFARQYLWAAGLDFEHGTGHGVGSYLSVHEGPQRISKLGTTPLEPGMILSNEPGYYKAGAYGIRLENLIFVVEKEIKGAEKPMLGFETLTQVPFEEALIVDEMLLPQEKAWLTAYHASQSGLD